MTVRGDESYLRSILLAIILSGICIALVQFFYNRSLWFDEAALALNFLNRSFLELLKPLDYGQLAPIGFLMVEKTAVSVMGAHEYALRLFPLLCYIISVPFLFQASANLTSDKTFAFLATALYSIHINVIDYATEVKQYAVDALVAIIALYLVSDKHRSVATMSIRLFLFGASLLWFSHITVLLLFSFGLYLLWKGRSQKSPALVFLSIGIAMVSYGIYFLFFIKGHPLKNYMQTYWREAFMPMNPFSVEFYQFLLEATRGVFVDVFLFRFYWIVPFLISLLGIAFLWRQKRFVLLYLCLSPFILHLFFSALKLYPFSGRLIHYLMPLLALIYTAGYYYQFKELRERGMRLSPLLLLLPVLIMLYPLWLRFPIQKEEIKKGLRVIEAQRKPGEDLYVYHASGNAVSFSRQSGFVTPDFTWVQGIRYRNELHRYDAELFSLEGRVWLLFSHISNTQEEGQTEEMYMIDYLLSHGGKILNTWKFKGAACYYIDTGR